MEYTPDESNEARWYVVHTYSGYENKVKEDLEKTIERRGLHDKILEVKFPTEDVTEIKDGKRRHIQRKIFPGYVMVKMLMDDQLWYIVRNTRGVTGFVGQPSKNIPFGGASQDGSYAHRRPIPLTDAEVTAMGVERMHLKIDIEVGESVRVVSGPLENFIGTVKTIDPERQKIKLVVEMFGRETSVELDFVEVQRL